MLLSIGNFFGILFYFIVYISYVLPE